MGTDVPTATPGWWHFLSPLLGMPATIPPQAVAGTESISAPLTSDTPVPQPGVKWWHHSSDQGMPDLGQEEEAPSDSPKEPPTRSRNLWPDPSGKPNKRPSPRTLRW